MDIPRGTEPNRNSRLSREPCLAAWMSNRPTLPTRQPLPSEWTSRHVGIAVFSGSVILAWLCHYPVVNNRFIYVLQQLNCPAMLYVAQHIRAMSLVPRPHPLTWKRIANVKFNVYYPVPYLHCTWFHHAKLSVPLTMQTHEQLNFLHSCSLYCITKS